MSVSTGGIVETVEAPERWWLRRETGQMVSNRDSRGVDQYASYNGLIFCKGSNADWISDFWEGENVAMRYAAKGNYRPVNTEPMSQGTRCRQLAEYVIFDSPFNMLCDVPIVLLVTISERCNPSLPTVS